MSSAELPRFANELRNLLISAVALFHAGVTLGCIKQEIREAQYLFVKKALQKGATHSVPAPG